MDSPYKDGEPPRLDLDYCFQIGDTPVYLMIGMENGAPAAASVQNMRASHKRVLAMFRATAT
jgi:hypothetical protein